MRFSLLFLVLFFGINLSSLAQNGFTGMLEYKISVSDTTLKRLYPDNKMIVYTNDTIVRIENFTDHLGKQVTIRHMLLDKSYILVETGFGKFAIRSHKSEDSKDTSVVEEVSDYSFKKKMGKRKILGNKAKRMLVTHAQFEEPIEFLYFKKYSPKIVDAFEEIPGLPVKYTIPTADVNFDYELVKMSEYTPDRDLFGIPSDYEKIDFQQFMDRLIEFKASSEQIRE